MARSDELDYDDEKAVARFHTSLKRSGITPRLISRFRKIILDGYEKEGRAFPWRETQDPYAILVSEIMLQQTQTSRVVPKFMEFMERFPNFKTLADAPLSEVLSHWQGLGYNRRGKALRDAAQMVVERFDSQLPADYHDLLTFPGIGPYTAGAVCAFAFDQPVVFMDTNIRRVFIHFFFPDRDKVRDSEIEPLVERTLDRKRPRDWYSALMDYGAMLKNVEKNPNKRSAHYTRQSKFEGSDRQIRGTILRELLAVGKVGMEKGELVNELTMVEGGEARGENERVEYILNQLEGEGFVKEEKGKWRISGD